MNFKKYLEVPGGYGLPIKEQSTLLVAKVPDSNNETNNSKIPQKLSTTLEALTCQSQQPYEEGRAEV